MNNVVKRARILAVFIATLLVCGCAAYFGTLSQARKELGQRADRLLDTLGTALDTPTDKYSYLPGIVGRHPVVIDALLAPREPGHVARANALLEEMNASAKTDTIYIVDDNGTTIASSNWNRPQSFVGKNFSFRPYFLDAILNGSGRFYAVGTVSLAPGYYVSHEVRHEGQVIGVAVVKIDLTGLDARWDREQGEMAVTDPKGVIFLTSRKDWKYRPTEPLPPEGLQELARTRQYEGVLKESLAVTSNEESGPDSRVVELVQQSEAKPGHERVSYLLKSRRLANSEWSIHVYLPQKDIEARALRSALLAIGAIAFGLLLVLYLRQAAHRIREREKSRAQLEDANQQLEQKNRELQLASDTLHRISITDHLTGAYTRRFFYESLTKLMSAARRHGSPLSLLMIDVDNFKLINDTYGHPVGDAVLQSLAASCRQELREADIFARFGGEEFIVALPDTGEQEAREVAERLRLAAMSRPLQTADALIRITISSGIAQFRMTDVGIEDMIRRADQALYQAKNAGRNQVVVH